MGSLDVASNDASKAPVTEDPEKPREINDPSGVVAADVDVEGGRDDAFVATTAEKAELTFKEDASFRRPAW